MPKLIFLTTALGVILGAFGAHGLKDSVSPEFLEIWKTGVFYHLIHGIGSYIALKENQKNLSKLFLIGIFFFSGSLYALVLTGIKIFGAITPIGGVIFILCWILLAFRVKETHE